MCIGVSGVSDTSPQEGSRFVFVGFCPLPRGFRWSVQGLGLWGSGVSGFTSLANAPNSGR